MNTRLTQTYPNTQLETIMHHPIFLKNICLSFSKKHCFENFSAQIYSGNRIAIIGRNGSGKSSLLHILRKALEPTDGEIILPSNLCIGYVEQTINDYNNLSGGQRLNKRLSEALGQFPDILLLDEPTNHLDQNNRKSLMKMLNRYHGTLIVVSHDTELLRNCIDTLWHIDNHKIDVFTGSYDDHIRERTQKRASVEKELLSLKRDKKDMHQALMKEQKRSASSKSKGQKNIAQNKWSTIVGKSKANKAEKTSGKRNADIDRKKQQFSNQLSDLRLPDIILPKFSLSSEHISTGTLLSIIGANIGYTENQPILQNISLSLEGKEKIAIYGKNGSGKSTLIKAILEDKNIIASGSWHLPRHDHIGYLDQHYSNLSDNLSVLEHLKQHRPDWTETEARRHLNDFLFRTNEEVLQTISHLSGGEKARLSLSMIAAKMPKLLILDEITNNLDLETKEHTTQVLKSYPGAMIIISHEDDFLEALGIDRTYSISNGQLT